METEKVGENKAKKKKMMTMTMERNQFIKEPVQKENTMTA